MLGLEGAREVDAVQWIHLNVEKQEMRPLGADSRESGLAVGVLADHLEVRLRLAKFAQHPACGRFVIDDDDVHYAASRDARRAALRRSGAARIQGIVISLTHSLPEGPATSRARPSN